MHFTFRSLRTAAVVGFVGLLATAPGWVSAFQEPAAAPKEQEVQIAREAIHIDPPQLYKQQLSLTPMRTLEVPAPADGYLRTLNTKLGSKTGKESELLRLDDARALLVLKGAKARLQAAQIEKGLTKEEAQKSLVEARAEAAQADVELAQLDADRLVVRAPFAGEIHEIHVVEGQFVRAGQSLLTLSEVSQLRVEVPVDGTEVKAGSELELKVGETPAKGKVEVVLPPSRRFESLRDLCDTLQTAVVVFDNSAGRFSAGQSVYCDLIPKDPVTRVATTAVKNRNDGTRKVQVLRNNIVRDIPVRIHSKVGTERAFVSGAFREGDELIVKTTLDLADGTPVREYLSGATAQEGGAPARPGTTTKPGKPGETSF